jgi:hypothetical protein
MVLPCKANDDIFSKNGHKFLNKKTSSRKAELYESREDGS